MPRGSSDAIVNSHFNGSVNSSVLASALIDCEIDLEIFKSLLSFFLGIGAFNATEVFDSFAFSILEGKGNILTDSLWAGFNPMKVFSEDFLKDNLSRKRGLSSLVEAEDMTRSLHSVIVKELKIAEADVKHDLCIFRRKLCPGWVKIRELEAWDDVEESSEAMDLTMICETTSTVIKTKVMENVRFLSLNELTCFKIHLPDEINKENLLGPSYRNIIKFESFLPP